MVTSPPGDPPRSVEAHVRAEQIRLLYEQGSVAFVVNGAVAVLLAWLIGPHVPRASLVAWSSCFTVAWILRGSLHVWHWRAPDALRPHAWQTLFALGTFLAGATWGLTALWLFPTSTTDRFLDAVAIMGLASGAAASLSCVRGIYPLYLFPAFLPVAVRFAFESGTTPFIIIVLSALYCVGMSAAASVNYRQIVGALRLRFQNAELAQMLEALATHDALTGLANRRMLMERLDAAIRRAKRSRNTVATIFVDCDGFKEINDSFGHAIGDEFLRRIADALVRSVRETDTVARIGGDEFVAVLEEVTDPTELARVVARLRARASQSVRVGDLAIAPHLSIGIACYPVDGTNGETLIRHADQAMYRAKRAGGDLAEFFHSENGEAATYDESTRDEF